MKVVILAGGMGSRLAELTEVIPKPLVEIGGRPILWHIMKHYAQYGHKEFIVALGYKGWRIKEYFLHYKMMEADVSVELASGKTTLHNGPNEDWKIHLIETGLETLTGGRLGRLKEHVGNSTFMLTYGDGLSNVDIDALLKLHQTEKRIGTVTAVRPPARFGGLDFEGSQVKQFVEKPQIGEGWINGGFLVLEPGIFKYLTGDRCSLEYDVLEALTRDKQLSAYRHPGFWQCMDTVRDRQLLENLWSAGQPPWKTWA